MEEKVLADFLLRKFRPRIKEKFPQHYLVQPIPFKVLNFIKESAKKYPYFLRFDIRFYYPSINHQILLKKLPEVCGNTSRRFKKYLKKDIPAFLCESPYGKGLSISSALSYALAAIFPLDLDFRIKNPFLRQTDDYLIFCKNKKEPEKLLQNIISPKLSELGLEINEKKLKSGRFYQDKVNFIGFEFYAGYFRIKQEKIEEFREKIRKLTYLTKNKPKEAVIKSLNNQILGFGHYYKFASAKKEFEELDGFIRMRLRRYIGRNKDSKNKEWNLLLTNSVLEKMGLKSLLAIKEKYAQTPIRNKFLTGQEKRHIFQKKARKKPEIGKSKHRKDWQQLEEISEKYRQKLILSQLTQLTSLVKKLERRIANLERKLAKKKD